MASVDVLYETPFPQRSTTRVKNACAWDGTGRLVRRRGEIARRARVRARLVGDAPLRRRRPRRRVGYRAEGGGLSLAADVALRHPDERPVVSFAVGSGVLGVLAGARAELWTDRGCVILPVDDASCLAVLDDERVACGGAAGGARVFGVDGAPKGPLFDGGDASSPRAGRTASALAEIAAEEPDFAKRAEGFARLRVRALGARDAALGNADLRGAPRTSSGCASEHALACGWGSEPRAPPDALRAPRVAAAAEATLAALRSARSDPGEPPRPTRPLEDRLAAFLRQAGDVAGSPCPLCEAPLPLSRRDVLRGAAASACGAGPVDVCARTPSAIPLAEDARTCPACGLRLRDAPDKLPHLGDLAAQCPLCDLGTGAFSRVVKATKRMANNEAGQAVAVKCITKTPDLKAEDIASLREEVAVLQSIEHPNIIKLYNFYEEKKMFYMVIELMEGGELFERIVKKTFYNEKEARDLIRILLDALAYLHHRHIVHRDLKPENLLLKSPYNDFDIKLADFGFAKKVNGKSLDTQCGTPGYVAPEILKGAKYGTEVDMWSCGVIVYILLGGYPPFHDDNHAILYRKIKAADYTFEPQYWDQVSDDAKDLIKKMLVVDPDKRLTADQALRHPWFLVGDHELISRNLSTTLDTMKKFNARRKFRGTVKGIMLTNKMARGFN
ncbi:serine/threonine kinase [Aureococcus anophagefferens]|nr:serine/threonine kinase [Aureococcus anophagefferens]